MKITIMYDEGEKSPFRTFFDIAKEWGLSEIEQQSLLAVSKESFFKLKRHANGEVQNVVISSRLLRRTTFVKGIHGSLAVLFSEKTSRVWVGTPNKNPLFKGKSPLELMCHGDANAGLEVVSRHLVGAIVH